MVESALLKKPGGDDVLEEYKSENSLKHSTRRQLVNILASHMTEMHGRIPSRKQKEKYALGIIRALLRWGKNTGYLSWRLRTMSRKNRATRSQQAVPATVPQAQGPNCPRSAPTVPHQLDGDACREALSFLVHSPDEATVFEKMKITLQHRQDLVRDPQRTADVFKTFPRFLDVKGLLTQDFLLLFGTETACKMFEKSDTAFKIKIIKEAKHLTQSTELCRLLNAAETLAENDDTGWDSDMACLLLLLYLLPPTAGRKRTKISPSDAVDKMVNFHKSCCSIDEHLRGRKGQQPYILAAGRTRNRIDTFYIVIDKQLIACQATSSLGAFDELLKSHYVFNLSYEESLVQLYTFVQTTVYNIDINTTDESPRIRELRAKLLN
ncbi:Protein Smaug like 1 [Dissostichus eleginoides]|uniref:Protein Smaug like 1 n=1 Tax=Dissostichus eleginoides TaxID=100907 RepID=A0AAD9C6E8_DISEL|nr:Protein Smaug like 1 [Dissostichus eleginoides]